jgi:hypothetical protein
MTLKKSQRGYTEIVLFKIIFSSNDRNKGQEEVRSFLIQFHTTMEPSAGQQLPPCNVQNHK